MTKVGEAILLEEENDELIHVVIEGVPAPELPLTYGECVCLEPDNDDTYTSCVVEGVPLVVIPIPELGRRIRPIRFRVRRKYIKRLLKLLKMLRLLKLIIIIDMCDSVTNEEWEHILKMEEILEQIKRLTEIIKAKIKKEKRRVKKNEES